MTNKFFFGKIKLN